MADEERSQRFTTLRTWRRDDDVLPSIGSIPPSPVRSPTPERTSLCSFVCSISSAWDHQEIERVCLYAPQGEGKRLSVDALRLTDLDLLQQERIGRLPRFRILAPTNEIRSVIYLHPRHPHHHHSFITLHHHRSTLLVLPFFHVEDDEVAIRHVCRSCVSIITDGMPFMSYRRVEVHGGGLGGGKRRRRKSGWVHSIP